MAPKIGGNNINQYIFPTFLDLAKDEEHDILMAIVNT